MTLALISGLAAYLLPMLLRQLGAEHPYRASFDLETVRTATEVFHANTRGAYPGDLEDLAYRPTAADLAADSTAFSVAEMRHWNGPHLDAPMEEGGETSGAGLRTGYSWALERDLKCFNAATNTRVVGVRGVCPTSTSNNDLWLAVEIKNVLASEFEEVNDLVDGEHESDDLFAQGPYLTSEARQKGKLRLPNPDVLDPSQSEFTIYHLLMPYVR